MSIDNLPASDEQCMRRFERWDDEALARAAKAGDGEARNALYLRHSLLVRRLGGQARHMVRAAMWVGRVNVVLDPEDVDQQAFVLFCEALAAWQPGGDETFMVYLRRKLPWLLRRYVHLALTGRRGDPHLRTTPFEGWVENTNALEGLDAGQQAESHVSWDGQMGSLPSVLRGLVKLRYSDDLKSAQIADLIGQSQRKINRKLHEAISILRAELEEDWEDV